jgi:hypothetical protein
MPQVLGFIFYNWSLSRVFGLPSTLQDLVVCGVMLSCSHGRNDGYLVRQCTGRLHSQAVRWKTSWGLEELFGVRPRLGRIDTP